MMNKTQVRNSLLLLLTATIWGVAFVAQSVGMDYVGPFTFNMVRSQMCIRDSFLAFWRTVCTGRTERTKCASLFNRCGGTVQILERSDNGRLR